MLLLNNSRAIPDTCDNTDIHNNLISAINTAAEKTIPKEKERLVQPWQDDNVLKQMYEERDQLKRNNGNREELTRVTKKIGKRARFLRDEHFKAEAEKINQFAINRELDRLFSAAKRQETTLKAVPNTCHLKKMLFISNHTLTKTTLRNPPHQLNWVKIYHLSLKSYKTFPERVQ